MLDVAAGTGDFTRELVRQGHVAVATDLSFGMLHAGKTMDERVQADASALPFRTGRLRRRDVWLRAAQLQRSGRDLRRDGARRAPGRPAVAARGRRTALRALARRAFVCGSDASCPFIGSLVSDRAAYHYLPESTAYLPASDEIVAMLNRAGFAAVNHRRVMGGLSPTVHRDEDVVNFRRQRIDTQSLERPAHARGP